MKTSVKASRTCSAETVEHSSIADTNIAAFTRDGLPEQRMKPIPRKKLRDGGRTVRNVLKGNTLDVIAIIENLDEFRRITSDW